MKILLIAVLTFITTGCATDVDCPDTTTVLDGDEMRCEITDAATGDRYELTVTFDDFILREGYSDRLYSVGNQPL